jgi:uncharacterized membrane protein YdjX (TVP38/TMEM64 family)
MTRNHKRFRQVVTGVRWLSIAVILASLLVIARSSPIGSAMEGLKGRIGELGIWGPVAFVLVYIVATVLFVPGTLLTLAAGALFGITGGMLIVSLGSTVGASLAFLIARYFARQHVAALAARNRMLGAIDRAIAEGGWKVVAMLRLSPLIPFNLQNYLYGLTPIRFVPYVISSWLAMLPGTLLYVYLGHVTGATLDAERRRTPVEWMMLGVGLFMTVVATIYLTRLARRKLREHMNEAPTEDRAPPSDGEKPRNAADAPSLRVTIILAAVAIMTAAIAGFLFVQTR